MATGYRCMMCMDGNPNCEFCTLQSKLKSDNKILSIAAKAPVKSKLNIYQSKFKIGEPVMFGEQPVTINEITFSHAGVVYSCRMPTGYVINFDEFELEKI